MSDNEDFVNSKPVRFADMCRFCLTISNKMRHLSVQNLIKSRIPGIYEVLTGLKLSISEAHSKYVCSVCEQQINHFDQFRQDLLQVHNFWQTILPQRDNIPTTAPVTAPIELVIQPAHMGEDDFITINNETASEENPDGITYEEVEYLEEINEFESVIDTVLNPSPKLLNGRENDTVPSSQSLIDKNVIRTEILDCAVCGKDCNCPGKDLPENKTTCPICGRTNLKRLNDHLRNHQKAGRYKCPVCTNGFTRKVMLRIHMRVHTGERQLLNGREKDSVSASQSLKHKNLIRTEILDCAVCGKDCNCPNTLKTYCTGKDLAENKTTCPICGKTNLKRLNEHLRNHQNAGRYKCPVCAKGFTRKVWVRNHMRVHTGERPYICHVCAFPFTTSEALKRHLKKHNPLIAPNYQPPPIPTSNLSFKCAQCGIEFLLKRTLQSHIRREHDVKDTGESNMLFKCVPCGIELSTSRAIKDHMRIEHGVIEDAKKCVRSNSSKMNTICHICGKTDLKDLYSHLRRHSNVCRFKCSVCAKGFCHESDLNVHMRVHTGERPYICEICSFRFSSVSALRSHIKTHSGPSSRVRRVLQSHENLFKCDYCGIEYSVKTTLLIHMKIDHGLFGNVTKPRIKSSERKPRTPQKPKNQPSQRKPPLIRMIRLKNYNAMENRTLECSVCDRGNFRNREHLRTHLLAKHRENWMLEWKRVKNTVCALCNRIFSNSIELADHKSLMHRNYQCDICKQFYNNKKTLEFHIQHHTSRHRPHQCQVCGARYLYKSNLNYHFRKAHTNDRNFACDTCTKVFAHRSELTAHQLTHTSVRPFQCQHCPKTFKCSKTLQKHLRRHTGRFRYKCTICETNFVNGFDLTEHMENGHGGEGVLE